MVGSGYTIDIPLMFLYYIEGHELLGYLEDNVVQVVLIDKAMTFGKLSLSLSLSLYLSLSLSLSLYVCIYVYMRFAVDQSEYIYIAQSWSMEYIYVPHLP